MIKHSCWLLKFISNPEQTVQSCKQVECCTFQVTNNKWQVVCEQSCNTAHVTLLTFECLLLKKSSLSRFDPCNSSRTAQSNECNLKMEFFEFSSRFGKKKFIIIEKTEMKWQKMKFSKTKFVRVWFIIGIRFNFAVLSYFFLWSVPFCAFDYASIIYLYRLTFWNWWDSVVDFFFLS